MSDQSEFRYVNEEEVGETNEILQEIAFQLRRLADLFSEYKEAKE